MLRYYLPDSGETIEEARLLRAKSFDLSSGTFFETISETTDRGDFAEEVAAVEFSCGEPFDSIDVMVVGPNGQERSYHVEVEFEPQFTCTRENEEGE